METTPDRMILLGIELVPAFANDVPGDVKHLKTTRFGLDEILLQWRHADSTDDPVVHRRPVWALSSDEECAVARLETGGAPALHECHAVEIAKHRFGRWQLPCPGMMRGHPAP